MIEFKTNSKITIIQFVNPIYDSNSYIIYRENEQVCWLIDCGNSEELLEWIFRERKTPIGILITHAHYDHINGLNTIIFKYPECKVFLSDKGINGLYSDILNLSKYTDNSFVFHKKATISIVTDGDKIKLFNDIDAIVIETPGHDWSCLSYKVENNIFTGDSFIPETKIVTIFPKSNIQKANESVKKILQFKNKELIIYPGHKSPESLEKIIGRIVLLNKCLQK